MTPNRLFRTWLRPIAGLTALAAMLALSACGGGSGPPNNPYAPGPGAVVPLNVLPKTITVYSGVPSTLEVTGGVQPYSAFSSNPTILPISQAVAGTTVLLVPGDVGSSSTVTVTIQDAVGTTVTASVTVTAAPLLANLITVLPSGNCGAGNNLCSGGTGTASVVVTSPGGAGIANRQVRFDVVSGSYAIQTNNPALPLAPTLTVVTDGTGKALVGLAVNVGAVTQIASIRATDVTSGNQVTGSFTIQQITDGSGVLSVIPTGNTTIKGPDNTQCSSGADVAYYIFGGTPPYSVSVPFPSVVSLIGVPVRTSGGHFDVITNGSCFDSMQFVITDASGRTIPGGSSATLTNALGANPPVVAPPPLTASPPAYVSGTCLGTTFTFTVVGGTAPYSVSASPIGPTFSPSSVIAASGSSVDVSGLLNASGITTLTFKDQGSPQKTTTTKITCS
jgi:hypothetical protein